MSQPFRGLNIPLDEGEHIKRRYSVTGDIVSFRRCPRQYGAFGVHNYAPAYQTQLYFGQVIHQVLDQCHNHFHGIQDPATMGQIPDNGEILSDQTIEDYFKDLRDAYRQKTTLPPPPSQVMGYFLEVESGLKSKGIRAITPDMRLKAIRILQYFNRLEGPVLYGRVIDTEHRLQADQGNHILNGVVDLLVDADNRSNDHANYEIWDYKATPRITLTPQDLETYEFQMRVYARLYERKHGVQPRRAILYFLNELDGPTPPTRRPVNALLSVDLDPAEVQHAIDEFSQTVNQIEANRLLDQWLPPAPNHISERDCAICDLRWDCPTPNNGQGVEMRYP